MKVLISGGGTGGHIFPSLAIAEEITARDPENEILFVGTRRGLESRLIPEAGYRFEAVSGAGVSGGGLFRLVSGAFLAALGVLKSLFIVAKFRPDVAVGMGGYASFPAVFAARVMGVPVAICEQNSVSGLANRLLGKIARRVFLAFPRRGEQQFPAGKIRLVGNPVRREIVNAALKSAERKRPSPPQSVTIFVLGGSQGAGSLNRLVPPAVAELKNSGQIPVRVIHQTGKRDAPEVARAYESAAIEAEVFDFSPDVARCYSEADLVVSRAGAGAVAEIALFSLPSVLVPYPFAARRHQHANAQMMEEAGAAVVIDEKEMSEKAVAKTLQTLLNWNTLGGMSRAAAAVAAPDAAKRIADEIEILAGG